MNEPRPPVIQTPMPTPGVGGFPGMAGSMPAPQVPPVAAMPDPVTTATVGGAVPGTMGTAVGAEANGGVVDMFSATTELRNNTVNNGGGMPMQAPPPAPAAIPGNAFEMPQAVAAAPSVDLPPEMEALETEEERNGTLGAAGGAPPMFENGRLVPPVETPPAASEMLGSATVPEAAKKSKKEKAEGGKSSSVATIVIAVIALVVVVGFGVGFFLTWQKNQQQIAKLNVDLKEKTQTITNLNNELVQANDLMLKQQDLPVYVDNKGAFSFLQEISGLKVEKAEDSEVAELTYGEVDAGTVIDGFAMQIENKLTNGLTLATIADRAFNSTAEGAENFDLREEKIGDTQGYSFLSVVDGVQKLIYFLQRDAQGKNYLEITYQIKARTQTDYDLYEDTVFAVLNSLKIY